MFTRKWTEKEKSYLEKEYPKGTSFTVMADHLDRTEWAVKKKAYEMELPSRTRKPKSPGKKPGKTRSTRPRKASLNLLRGRESTELDWKLYYYRSMNLSIREIAEKVGMKMGSVQNRMSRYGLSLHPPTGEPPEWFKQKKDSP